MRKSWNTCTNISSRRVNADALYVDRPDLMPMTLRWMRLLEKLTLAQIEFGDTLLLEFISLPIPWAFLSF